MTIEERKEAAKKLRDAISHTSARVTNLKGSLAVRDLRTLTSGSRIVADSPNGDAYVAVKQGTKIAFIYAPLARPSELLNCGAGEEHYLASLKAEFDAKELANPGTDLTNLRFVSKREFNQLLIPLLEQILLDTEATLKQIESDSKSAESATD